MDFTVPTGRDTETGADGEAAWDCPRQRTLDITTAKMIAHSNPIVSERNSLRDNDIL
jgi:hypothetical protein